MINIAVFISGGGSNMRAIAAAIEKGDIAGARLALVVSSKTSAGGIDFANQNNIPSAIIDYKGKTEDEIELELKSLMRAYSIDFIALAGFVKVLPAKFTKSYERRIVNIHPSLIPLFCGRTYYGLRVHEAAISSGMKVSGATVHYVDAGVDTGKIIAQETCKIEKNDTAESLQKRVLKIEHKIYSRAIGEVIAEIAKTGGNYENGID